jgi:parallel beta-helix repeat protein
VTISRLTIQNGHAIASFAGDGGGAIRNANGAHLTLTEAALENNRGDPFAGALDNDGTAELLNVAMTGNSGGTETLGALLGGPAAMSNSGTARLIGTTITENRSDFGTALSNGAGYLEVRDSLVQANVASGISSSGELYISNTKIIDNVAVIEGLILSDGGIEGGGFMTIEDSTISGNWASEGGGIFYSGGGPGLTMVRIERSTISGNTAGRHGGGIYTWTAGTIIISNSTISGNTAGEAGGGIYALYGDIQVVNSTIADHAAPEGSALYNTPFNEGVGGITLHNSLIAGGGSQAPCLGLIQSAGHNATDADGCALDAPTDILAQDLHIGPLADNGGPTPTHALLPGSPAIDAGSSADCPATDQRGQPRPANGNGDGLAVCDIGAYEHFQPHHGDANCDGGVNSVDALYVLRWTAGMGPPVPLACEPLADADCNGAINAVDALSVLRYVATLPVNTPPGCPALGAPR